MTTPATASPNTPERPEPRLTARAVAAIVAAEYDIPLSSLNGQTRTAAVVEPRQVAMWLASHHLGMSLPRIGRAIGNRDHTTVLHACRRIDERRVAEPELVARLDRLGEKIADFEVRLAARTVGPPSAAMPDPAETPEPDQPEPSVSVVTQVVGPAPRERRVCEAAGRFLKAHDRLRRSLYTPGERAARQDTAAALECLREAYGAPAGAAGGGGR